MMLMKMDTAGDRQRRERDAEDDAEVLRAVDGQHLSAIQVMVPLRERRSEAKGGHENWRCVQPDCRRRAERNASLPTRISATADFADSQALADNAEGDPPALLLGSLGSRAINMPPRRVRHWLDMLQNCFRQAGSAGSSRASSAGWRPPPALA